LFSLFGDKENKNWLIPSLVESMLTTKQMDFTLGEQKYAYLYVKDFVLILNKIITMPVEAGVYNISSDQTRTIKSLVEDIRDYINPEFILNFGVLNYRNNQSMHMEGDILKLCSQIGEVEFSDFNEALHSCLNNYIKK
jgi:nucleoside-diphosphate-sugar epimerase